MSRNIDPFEDNAQAERERLARQRLAGLDPSSRPAGIPPAATELLQRALRRPDELSDEDLRSALCLVPAARAEVEGLETGLLFLARGAGLTWAQIADAMGFRSPQACQQHYARLASRRGSDR